MFLLEFRHHKLRILTVLQELGHQVAMTGDGVNDAPAVKKADIGIVVGSGTDLAKSVSDMILLDDNFATIINGIKEGRRIFFNIRKFVRYLLSANFGEILVVMGSLFLGTPLPLLPLQILWMNLATDSLPALALTSDTVGEEVMHKKPYKPQKEIINKVVSFAVLIGVISFITTMGIFLFSYNSLDLNLHHARTLALTSLVMFELFLAFSIRSETEPFWVNLFENRFLWFSVGVGFLGQLFIIYHPLGQAIFETASLNLIDWVLVLVGSTSGFVVVELLKYIDRKFPRIGRFIPLVDNNEHPPV
jgi:Ca2+-transporting ATPase